MGCSPWGCKELDTTERLHFLSFYSSFWRRKWQPTPVFLPGESCGQRGLVGCCPEGRTESDTTKQLTHKHTLTWGVHLSVSYLFAFSYCSRGSQGKNTEVVCQSLLQRTTYCLYDAAAAKSRQSCSTLCDPIHGSPPGSSVHGILQTRMLE